MVAGFERYFQIVKCFPGRGTCASIGKPEFTPDNRPWRWSFRQPRDERCSPRLEELITAALWARGSLGVFDPRALSAHDVRGSRCASTANDKPEPCAFGNAATLDLTRLRRGSTRAAGWPMWQPVSPPVTPGSDRQDLESAGQAAKLSPATEVPTSWRRSPRGRLVRRRGLGAGPKVGEEWRVDRRARLAKVRSRNRRERPIQQRGGRGGAARGHPALPVSARKSLVHTVLAQPAPVPSASGLGLIPEYGNPGSQAARLLEVSSGSSNPPLFEV